MTLRRVAAAGLLSAPGRLLVSYNVNTFDFWANFAKADIYRSRFIRLHRP